MTSTRPEETLACSKSCRARVSAGASRLPGAGMMSGFKAGSSVLMVSVSSVSGVTACASPAKVMSPVMPSVRLASRSSNLRFAAVSRLGAVSVAYMLQVRSRMTTKASSRTTMGCGAFSQVGPASATTVSSQTAAKRGRGRSRLRWPRLTSKGSTRSLSSTSRQALARATSRCKSQIRIGSASSPTSQMGRKK